jgi:hypothetical protein
MTVAGTSPAPRAGARAAYDRTADRVYVFGGTLEGGAASGEVWALNLGASPSWSLVADNPSGPARTLAVVALDEPTSTLVVSLGQSNTGADCANDTSGLSLTAPPSWAGIVPTGEAPRPRYNGVAFAHDTAGRRLFAHGGEGFGNADGGTATACLPCCPYYDDTFVLSLTPPRTWSRLSPSGTAPPGTGGASMIWDPFGQRLVRFGGRTQRGELLGDTHALVVQAGGTAVWLDASRLERPAARGHAAAIYDPAVQRMLLFGGRGAALLQDTWALDLGSASSVGAWTPLAAEGTPPAAREQAAVVYLP